MSRRALVATGSVESVATFSGTPYHFLLAGRRAGFLHHGVELQWPPGWRARRLLWNAASPLRLEGPGGFLVHTQSIEALWRTRGPSQDIEEWLSFFPLLPPRSCIHEPVSYYLDATLQQNFQEYGYRVGHRTRRDALAREREAYEAAERIVCFSRWCADSLVRDYGIAPADLRVIGPGANLDETLVPAPAEWDGNLSPLRLGFIGVDWKRKGLPELLDTATLLAARGRAVEVVVIGPDPAALPRHASLRPLGFVSKASDALRFIEILRMFHFGCLLSRIDASPISLTECLRLGVPVIGTDVGGIRELVPEGAGIVVPPKGAAGHLADELDLTIANPERYAALRSAAAQSAPYFSWDRAVAEFEAAFKERT